MDGSFHSRKSSPMRLVSNFICCAPFRPNFLNSKHGKVVFYFIFLLFYCKMYKKTKKADRPVDVNFIGKSSFRRLNLVSFLYL